MGKQVIDWIGACIALRGLLVVICAAFVHRVLVRLAPTNAKRPHARTSRARRRRTRRRTVTLRKASLGVSGT